MAQIRVMCLTHWYASWALAFQNSLARSGGVKDWCTLNLNSNLSQQYTPTGRAPWKKNLNFQFINILKHAAFAEGCQRQDAQDIKSWMTSDRDWCVLRCIDHNETTVNLKLKNLHIASSSNPLFLKWEECMWTINNRKSDRENWS